MPEGRRPRGVNRRLTSGREAESARLRRHRNGREELPLFGGQGPAARRSPATEVRGGDERRYPASEVRVWEERATSLLRSGGAADLCFPTSEVRWGGREELPRVRGQGRMPEGATPGPQARGQGRLPGGATTRPRSRGCVGTGGPRGASG